MPSSQSVSAPQVSGRAGGAYLRILGRSLGGRSLEGASPDEARASSKHLLERLQRRFAAADLRHGTADPETAALRQIVLADAERALGRGAGEPGRTLDTGEATALEALVQTSGRPALLVQQGGYDPKDPEIDTYWEERLFRAGPAVRTLIASVGRIEWGGLNAGTAFLVAPGLVATNRHVLEAIATYDPGARSWTLRDAIEVNFDGEFGSAARHAFPVTGIAFAGPDPVGAVVRPARLDLALLTLQARSGTGQAPPPPLPLASAPSPVRGHCDLAVVGYPAKPMRLPVQGNGRVNPDVAQALQRIFRSEWDAKRLSLGRVDRTLGEVADDADPPWCFGHDATTLGGNSGSAVAVLEYFADDVPRVVGLHMGGQWLLQNFAHALAAIPALRDPALVPAMAQTEWID